MFDKKTQITVDDVSILFPFQSQNTNILEGYKSEK